MRGTMGFGLVLLVMAIAAPAFAQSETSVTVGAAGPGTTFNGVPIDGYGVEIGDTGSGRKS